MEKPYSKQQRRQKTIGKEGRGRSKLGLKRPFCRLICTLTLLFTAALAKDTSIIPGFTKLRLQSSKDSIIRSVRRVKWSAPIMYYKNHVSTYRLALSGDIEKNPGPVSCSQCTKTVRKKSKRMECSTCKNHTHLKCSGTNIKFANPRMPQQWTCHSCLLTQLPFYHVRDMSTIENFQVHDEAKNFTLPSISTLNQYRQHLSVAHLNTEAITSTFPEFENMLKSHDFDIITISETWLKDNQNIMSYLQIPGYVNGFRNREIIKGGGVGYYIKSDIRFKERNDLNSLDDSLESQWIEIKGKNRRSNTLIGTFYQPSSMTAEKMVWLKKFDDIISHIMIYHDGPIIITGDLNIDLMKSTVISRLYHEMLDTYNLKQHITKPTRKDTVLIDHILPTNSVKLIHEGG